MKASRSIANSLDSLSEFVQNHKNTDSTVANASNDRSRSLGDLLAATSIDAGDSQNGGYDTLATKSLTDSGICAGLINRDNTIDSTSPDGLPTDIVSSPESSYAAISFTSYDPESGVFSNENKNPLDFNRVLIEDRKHPELPAISEESEHEHSVHIPSRSVPPDREIVEHTYPMVHCNSAPSNSSFVTMAMGNKFAHRRVVSDDATNMTQLKRSKEMENIDSVERVSFEKGAQNLKKGRCKSAMLVFQEGRDDSSSSDEENRDGEESRDNEVLIKMSDKSGMNKPIAESFNNCISSVPTISNEPPPVRLSRKVSTVSARKVASEHSWKDKMPPFALAGHTMYSPQSVPSQDTMPRASFHSDGTISGSGSTSPQLCSHDYVESEVTEADCDECTLPFYNLISYASPTTCTLMPLSDICNQNRLSIASSVQTDQSRSPPKAPPGSANSSFVRRSLRKIMKRGTVSTSALADQYGELRNGSLKRRASNASSSFFASAQAHLKPRTKSLKKQRLGKQNKKEKTGSDTFTFGNFFRKKQPTSRPNLNDIISDLDHRATTSRQMPVGGSLSAGNRRSTSTSTLPAFSESGLLENSPLEGLPDHIARMVSPVESIQSSSAKTTSCSDSLFVQLDRFWGKYDLFAAEEYQSWHEKYRHNTLSTKQVKKQDAIYELYMMEKRHCANIAFLLQGYRRRMLEENIISKQDMDILIPDVLEPLLIFHLNVLCRITARMQENYEVSTISDIITEELSLDGGQHTKLCCNAYTDFGVAKERSDVLYHHLMNKNSKFSEFFKKTYSEEPFYKQYDFRPLITKIIGRATKYSLLLETILKNEQPFSEHHDLTKTALDTARSFAHKIDENLSIAHMSMKWDEIRAQIDPASSTNLHVSDPSVPHSTICYSFGLDSLNTASDRKLIHLGEAFIKLSNLPSGSGIHSSSSGKLDKTLIYLVLFDDIIVILCRKGSRLVFMHDQGVMPVQSLLTRTSARGHSIMLISGAKPVLFEISFHTSTERKKWVSHLEAAPKNVPPEGIRMHTDDVDGVLRSRVEAQQESEDKWMRELEELFQTRYAEEKALSNYLEGRLEFFDDVRAHMTKLPFENRCDISNRIREAVKAKFRELRRVRTIPLNQLVEKMGESRDSDLWSYFDERADVADVFDRSSDLTGDSSNSDDSATNCSSRVKPRRIQTFHGTSQPAPIGNAEYKGPGIRRHTTVPRLNTDGGPLSTYRASVDDDFEEEDAQNVKGREDYESDRKVYGEMVMNLPIRQTMRARQASTKLIKEVIGLRRENHLLRNENALTKSRCALLERVRGGTMMSSTASAVDESMEMLRKKEKDIREMQRQMISEREELLGKQKAIELQEKEIQSKWMALQIRLGDQTAPQHIRSPSSSHSSQVSSPIYKTQPPVQLQNSEWSPVLASLATKTETKKLKK
uniref:DH domain-containing protein n=1 Tax=Caenorhabditis japonica TaxID=281687 RepID=A0A8R1HP65_CAEJA